MVARRRFRGRRKTYRRRPRRSFKRSRRGGRRRRGGNRLNCRRGGTPLNYQIYDHTQYYGMGFGLIDLPTFSEFTALFDQYKLNCVVVKFRFDHTPDPVMQAEAGYVYTQPILRWVVDDTDATAFTTVNAMTECQRYKFKTMMPGRDISIKIYPKLQRMLYEGVGVTGYSPARGWVSTADTSVPHYGLKWTVDASAAAGTGSNRLGTVTMERTYYFSFRTTK